MVTGCLRTNRQFARPTSSEQHSTYAGEACSERISINSAKPGKSGPRGGVIHCSTERREKFLAPVNWHHDDHKEEELNWFKLGQWNNIEKTINMFENEQANTFEDNKDKDRKRKWLAIIIDATLRYHVLESGI